MGMNRVRLYWLMFAIVMLILPGTRLQAQQPVRLTYLFSDGQMSVTLAAYHQLIEQEPALASRVELNFITESLIDSVSASSVTASDVLVLDMMNQQLMETYNSQHGIELIRDIAAQGQVIVIGQGIQSPDYFTDQGAIHDDRAMAYWQHGGVNNQLGLLKYEGPTGF